MKSKRIFFPIMYYKEKAMINDYSAFCKYIDEVSVRSFADINDNHSFLFVASYNKDGITLFPSAKKHYSQNNSLMPVIFIEKKSDEEIKISAASYLSIALNLFLLLFLIIALVKRSVYFIIGTILFGMLSQCAFWIPLNKALEEVHRIIKVANTGEKMIL